jgi:hypothetical protein
MPGDPLHPYQYELVHRLMSEPLSAGELTTLWPFRHWHASPLSMANRLPPLVRHGWLDVEHGIYRATARARAAMCLDGTSD